MPAQQTAQREIKLMGGPQKVLALAKDALKSQPRWAMHLLSKLRTSRLLDGHVALKRSLATTYRAVAKGIFNTNGRAYLLESAIELEKGSSPYREAKPNLSMIKSVPLHHIFSIMSTRLKPASSMEKHESLVFVFPDEKKQFVLTIRRGVCEIIEGKPLPHTPEPIAVITLSAANYRKMALKLVSPLSLYAQGQITVKGSWLSALSFLRRFRF